MASLIAGEPRVSARRRGPVKMGSKGPFVKRVKGAVSKAARLCSPRRGAMMLERLSVTVKVVHDG